MIVYNKLVRDRIPEIIAAEGKSYETRVLEDTGFLNAVLEKFEEELQELKESRDDKHRTEELADLLELVHTMCNELGISMEQLEKIRVDKRQRRGGFEKKIFLISVDDKN